MDNSGLDGGPLADHLHRVGLGSHAKLERQGSKGSKGCSTPSRKVQSPLGNRVETDKQSEDLHALLSIVGFSKDVRLRQFLSVSDTLAQSSRPQNC